VLLLAAAAWSREIEHDGFRILARKQGERVQFWSRRGNMSKSCSAAVR
jgi:ATP-dependent DNA ligase